MSFKQQLWGRALERHGYVTTKDAVALSIPAVELRKMAYRGTLTNVARGLYRFPEVPDDDRDEYAVAVLTVGDDAFLDGLSVLAMFDLAQVNPRKVEVGSPRRVRLSSPGAVKVTQRDLPAADRTVYDGVPSATVARAFKDSVGKVMTSRLIAGAADARKRGLLTEDEFRDVCSALPVGSGL